MKRYTFSRFLVTMIVLFILSLSFLFLSYYGKSQVSSFSQSIKNFFSPIASVVDKPVQFLSEKKDSISDLFEALDENRELKKTLFSLETISSENEVLRAENESLRANLGIQEEYGNQNQISSMVFMRTPTAWNQELILDSGSQKGIKDSMLVLANGGLVGVIDSVTNESATVTLLTNTSHFSKIQVKISTGTETVYGILSGYDHDSHSFTIGQLNKNVAIAKGSKVVTSDLGGDLPENILVGSVQSVTTNSSNLDSEISVNPAADFSNIYSVVVIGK